MQRFDDLFIERELNDEDGGDNRKRSSVKFYPNDELATKYYKDQPLSHINEIAWKDLRHPFIAPFFGAQICNDNGQVLKYFAKYISINQDFQMLDDPKLMYQYIRTVLYLRHKFIAHNDLSEDNILVDKKTGNIQFIDFGVLDSIDKDTYASHNEYVPGFLYGFNDVYSTLLRLSRSKLLSDYDKKYIENLRFNMIKDERLRFFKDTDGRYEIVIQQIANTLKHQLASENKNILINYHKKCNVMHDIAENAFNSVFLSEYPQHIFNEFLKNDANAICALGELLLTGMHGRLNDTKSEIFDTELQYCEIPQRTRTAYLLFKKAMQNFSTHATERIRIGLEIIKYVLENYSQCNENDKLFVAQICDALGLKTWDFWETEDIEDYFFEMHWLRDELGNNDCKAQIKEKLENIDTEIIHDIEFQLYCTKLAIELYQETKMNYYISMMKLRTALFIDDKNLINNVVNEIKDNLVPLYPQARFEIKCFEKSQDEKEKIKKTFHSLEADAYEYLLIDYF